MLLIHTFFFIITCFVHLCNFTSHDSPSSANHFTSRHSPTRHSPRRPLLRRKWQPFQNLPHPLLHKISIDRLWQSPPPKKSQPLLYKKIPITCTNKIKKIFSQIKKNGTFPSTLTPPVKDIDRKKQPAIKQNMIRHKNLCIAYFCDKRSSQLFSILKKGNKGKIIIKEKSLITFITKLLTLQTLKKYINCQKIDTFKIINIPSFLKQMSSIILMRRKEPLYINFHEDHLHNYIHFSFIKNAYCLEFLKKNAQKNTITIPLNKLLLLHNNESKKKILQIFTYYVFHNRKS